MEQGRVLLLMGLIKIFCLAVVSLLLVGLTASAQFPIVNGRVTDRSGLGIDNTDLDFFIDSNGVKLLTPTIDKTKNGGLYSLAIVPNLYNIAYDPPPRSHLLGAWRYKVGVFSGTTTINVTLDSGLAVSGVVTDLIGNSISGVDLDADSLAGGRVYTPNDKIEILDSGKYWIVVPPGDYRIRYDSPPGSRFLGVQIDSVRVSADLAMPPIVMDQGLILSGKVTDQTTGSGIYRVDIDLRDAATGRKLFVSNNKTDTAGLYSVAVPSGLYEVRIAPPVGSGYVGVRVENVSISSDLVMNQALQSGTMVTVNITDSAGAPVVGADLDFKLQSTGLKVFTPNDKTNVNGTAIVSVLPDTYTVQLDPPIGTIFDQVVSAPITLFSDTVLNFVMPEVPRIRFSGRIVGGTGSGLADIKIGLRIQPFNRKVYIPTNLTDQNGNFDLSVPIGQYDLLISPPGGSRLVGQRISDVLFVNDTTANFILSNGLIVTGVVLDRDGLPLEGIDFDFVSETNGGKVFTPFDNTDLQGVAIMALPSDVYSVVLSPPTGSLEASDTSFSVRVRTDTTLTFHFGSESSGRSGQSFVLRQNYPNPFNDRTAINFSLLEQGELKIEVFNTLGQLVKSLESGYYPAGGYEIEWDGTNSSGKNVASGIYYYRLKTPAGTDSRSMVILR